MAGHGGRLTADGSLDRRQCVQDILVRGTNLVIDLDHLPAHNSFGVDHERSRMSDLAAFRVGGIEQTVPVDHLMPRVRQQWEVGDDAVFHGDPVDHLLEIIRAVHRQRENLRGALLLIVQEALQLPELLGAVGSPVAAVEHQHDILVTTEIRQCDHVAG